MRSLLIAFIALFATTSLVLAQTGAVSPAQTGDTSSTDRGLRLQNVNVVDVNTFEIHFNQSINVDSIRLRLVQEKNTKESIQITSIDAGTGAEVAIVKVANPLVAGEEYTLTLIDAASQGGDQIRTGVDSIYNFNIPLNISGANLAAPTNPAAVIATNTGTTSTETATSSTTPTIIDPAPTNTTNTDANPTKQQLEEPVETDKLPETGTHIILSLFVALLIAGLLFFRRQQRS